MARKNREFTDNAKIEAFRLPRDLSEAARLKARNEDLTFSQLMRRALKRELQLASAK